MDKRNRLEIYQDILKSLEEEPLRITHIADKAHLNFNQTRKRVNKLLERGLVREEDEYYHITEDGGRFVELFSDLKEFIE